MTISRVARMVRIVVPAVVIVLIGCAPILSDRSLQEADLSISFQEILNNPNACKGKLVVVGGRIITTTTRNEETWIEILQQPLDRKYMPENSDVSYGRFLMILKGGVDAAVYAPGRRIAIAGEITGETVMPIKEKPYTYPIITPREHVLIVPGYYYHASSRLYYNAGMHMVK